MYGAFLRGLEKEEVKVAQLAGFVSDKAAYHHGEASLMGAIIGMAQNFVGSNNINLLKPNGQYGSRIMGGSDSASPRYIWTMFESLTPLIFKESDNPVLTKQYDDEMPIEPEYYAPIVPMILINGTEGIGTGFSTKIPPYNPKEVISVIKKKIKNQSITGLTLDPWWQGFKGLVEKIDDHNYELHGLYQIKGNKLIIDELPVGEWTNKYKEYLEGLLAGPEVKESKKETKGKGKEKKKPIKKNRLSEFLGYDATNTDTTVHFELDFEPDYLESLSPKQLKELEKKQIIQRRLLEPSGRKKKELQK
jgi:DNA topoisomerase-2